MMIQVRWRPQEGINHFRFQMARDREFREILIDEKIDQAGIRIARPKVPGFYYVRTSSMDSKGFEGEFSRPQSFEIKPPSPPHFEKPRVDKKMIRLRWSSPEEDLNYHLQLAREETFQTILVDQKTPETSIDLKKPDAPGIYYVRVSGLDGDGNEGEFSTGPSSQSPTARVAQLCLARQSCRETRLCDAIEGEETELSSRYL